MTTLYKSTRRFKSGIFLQNHDFLPFVAFYVEPDNIDFPFAAVSMVTWKA